MAEPQHVVVTDVRMKFWSMVRFMVKWAFASIPALVVVVVVTVSVGAFSSTMLSAFLMRFAPSSARPIGASSPATQTPPDWGSRAECERACEALKLSDCVAKCRAYPE